VECGGWFRRWLYACVGLDREKRGGGGNMVDRPSSWFPPAKTEKGKQGRRKGLSKLRGRGRQLWR